MDGRKTTPELDALLERLKQARGFDATAYERATLDQLYTALLHNVTGFFRDPDAFAFLRTHIIPVILRDKPANEPIRIWSAGCASGEECYSLAMIVADILGPEQFRERVKVYATDVDDEELAKARQATYEAAQMEGVPEDLRAKYFEQADGRWTFRKDFRRALIFGRHDLMDDAPISSLDLLVCRNTLVYFTAEARARIVSRFAFSLRDGGFLVLGKTETLPEGSGAFIPVDVDQRVFRKHEAGPQSLQAAAGVLVLDANLKVERWNAAAATLLGVRDVVQGTPFHDLGIGIPAASLHRESELEIEAHGAGGRPIRVLVQISRAGGGAGASRGTILLLREIERRH